MKTRSSFLILCLALFINASLLFAQWQSTTMPGSPLSEIYSLSVKGTEVFAGTVDGVYRSTDDGAHWKEVNPILPARATQPRVWSLTVTGQYIMASFYETNLYVSSDDGANWKSAVVGEMGTAPLITAASVSYFLGGSPTSATYRSTDNGANWAQLGSPYAVRSIAMQDSIVLVTGSAGWATGPVGVFRSGDYGVTWNLIYTCQPNQVIGNPLALSGNRAVAGITYYHGCYSLASTDAGLTWTDSVHVPCNSINSIVYDPTQPEHGFVFAGTDSGVFRSSDNGAHWFPVNNGLLSTLVYSLAFKVEGTGGKTMLYAGTGGGLFFSTDFGNTWSQTLGPSQWVYATDGSTLFAASSNGSYSALGVPGGTGQKFDYKYYSLIYRSTDDGQNWFQTYSDYLDQNAQITSLAAIWDHSNGLHLLACGAWSPLPRVQNYHMVLASTNEGVSWTTTYADTVQNFLSIRTSSSGVFLSVYRADFPLFLIFRSTDDVGTWVAVDTPRVYMRGLCSDGDKIYTGGTDNIFYGHQAILTNFIRVSTDNGASWSSVKSPLDSTKIPHLVTDTLSLISSLYAAGPHLLVGMQAYFFSTSLSDEYYANGGGLFHLVQSDSTWHLVDSSLMGRSVLGFAASGSTIFAATDSGVFRSADYGTTWNDISSGMNNICVQSLFVSGSYLFASTSNGLWKRLLSEITAVDHDQATVVIPERYGLSQNYPNPFNPATTIEYQLPKKGKVTMKVFDVVGREVRTLVNGTQDAGSYKVRFDGSTLSSGVYFYKIQAGKFSDVKKLILMK